MIFLLVFLDFNLLLVNLIYELQTVYYGVIYVDKFMQFLSFWFYNYKQKNFLVLYGKIDKIMQIFRF